jgi:rRNA maturation RNase YbeY
MRDAVVVTSVGRRAPALAGRLRRSARRLLRALRLDGAELSVVLVSDAEMRRLNRRWRRKDRPTDVLSFAQRDGAGGDPHATWSRGEKGAPGGLLGDVVISVDTARRQAGERGASLGREGDRLLVHGLLHLLGYDHERSAAEARRMQRRERTLLGWLR